MSSEEPRPSPEPSAPGEHPAPPDGVVPPEADCADILDHLYEYLDQEMPDGDRAKFADHIDECSPCLEQYGLEQSVRKLVKRCCGQDEVPADLREKVMRRISAIRGGQIPPEEPAS